jgi:hypothetical protein
MAHLLTAMLCHSTDSGIDNEVSFDMFLYFTIFVNYLQLLRYCWTPTLYIARRSAHWQRISGMSSCFLVHSLCRHTDRSQSETLVLISALTTQCMHPPPAVTGGQGIYCSYGSHMFINVIKRAWPWILFWTRSLHTFVPYFFQIDFNIIY